MEVFNERTCCRWKKVWCLCKYPCKTKGFNVFLTEKAVNDEVKSYEPLLKKYGIPYEFGNHSFDKFYNFDLVVLSPGVPKMLLL